MGENMSSQLDKVIKHFGSQDNLALVLDVSKTAISLWKKRGVPIKRAFQIEKATKGRFKAKNLRPDIFNG